MERTRRNLDRKPVGFYGYGKPRERRPLQERMALPLGLLGFGALCVRSGWDASYLIGIGEPPLALRIIGLVIGLALAVALVIVVARCDGLARGERHE
jgi:hypothetical protein